jgi:hypothetical protein
MMRNYLTEFAKDDQVSLVDLFQAMTYRQGRTQKVKTSMLKRTFEFGACKGMVDGKHLTPLGYDVFNGQLFTAISNRYLDLETHEEPVFWPESNNQMRQVVRWNKQYKEAEMASPKYSGLVKSGLLHSMISCKIDWVFLNSIRTISALKVKEILPEAQFGIILNPITGPLLSQRARHQPREVYENWWFASCGLLELGEKGDWEEREKGTEANLEGMMKEMLQDH